MRYRHGKWGVNFIWKASDSVFPRALAWGIPCGTLSAFLSWLKDYLEYKDDISSTSVAAITSTASFMTILGFLVVFRSNQAWQRFWEAAGEIQNARSKLFNATSATLAFCSRKPEQKTEVANYSELLVRLMSLMFVTAVSSISSKRANYDVLDVDGIDNDTMKNFRRLADREGKTELILQWIQRTIVRGHDEGIISIPPPILSRVLNELSDGVSSFSAARKINEIPFPFHYAQMLSVMLIIYNLGAPVFYAYLLQTPPAAAASTFLNVTVLWCVNYLAADIECPFGMGPNDLPLDQEVERMNTLLKLILSEASRIPPTFNPPSFGIPLHERKWFRHVKFKDVNRPRRKKEGGGDLETLFGDAHWDSMSGDDASPSGRAPLGEELASRAVAVGVQEQVVPVKQGPLLQLAFAVADLKDGLGITEQLATLAPPGGLATLCHAQGHPAREEGGAAKQVPPPLEKAAQAQSPPNPAFRDEIDVQNPIAQQRVDDGVPAPKPPELGNGRDENIATNAGARAIAGKEEGMTAPRDETANVRTPKPAKDGMSPANDGKVKQKKNVRSQLT